MGGDDLRVRPVLREDVTSEGEDEKEGRSVSSFQSLTAFSCS